ncbi:MAG: hypothetical protein LBJ45_02930 [Holosporaceae bacterium]|jgi:hypothetical protein|nr:hypothetical protein [Holosporaceae bacterium]
MIRKILFSIAIPMFLVFSVDGIYPDDSSIYCMTSDGVKARFNLANIFTKGSKLEDCGKDLANLPKDTRLLIYSSCHSGAFGGIKILLETPNNDFNRYPGLIVPNGILCSDFLSDIQRPGTVDSVFLISNKECEEEKKKTFDEIDPRSLKNLHIIFYISGPKK